MSRRSLMTAPGRRALAMASGVLAVALTVLLPVAFLLPAGDARAGVKFGDAVAGIVKKSDLDRIRRVLGLERFSVIAAVLLGATEGREVLLAEPLTDEALAAVKKACEAKGFCPDPTGFVASRLRVVILHDGDISEVLSVGEEVRGPRRRVLDLEAMLPEGRRLGWSGSAGAESGHVSLEVTPIVQEPDGEIVEAIDPPLNLRWNEETARFQFFDCVEEDGETDCAFEPEVEE